MSSAHFTPFEADLDRETALSVLREAVAGADDGELFLERRRSEALVFDDGRLKTASYDAAEGFGLRAVQGEVAGYAHSTELSEASLRRASETARLAVGDGGGTWADAPQASNKRLYTDEDPIAGHAFPVKVDTLREIDAYARSFVGLPETNHLRRVISENRPDLDQAKAGAEIAKLIASAQRPRHGHVLLECTNLPPYKHAIQRLTGLPVTDILTCIEAAQSGAVCSNYLG